MAKWYYSLNDNREGPISLDELRRRIANGEIPQTELAWTDGMDEWKAISSLKELLPVSETPRLPINPTPDPLFEGTPADRFEPASSPEPTRRPQRNWEDQPEPSPRRNRTEDDRDDYDDGPRRRNGIQPHRAVTVFVLAQLGLILWAPLSFLSPLLLGLSVPAFFMSKNDLKTMREGRMDRGGEVLTRAAFAMSITGLVLHSLCTCGMTVWFVGLATRIIR